MADNVTANSGTGGATFRTDDDGTAHWPYTKLAWGADNTQTIVTTGASAVPIQDGGNTITVDGTVTADAGTGPWPVTDNAGSLTVDNAALSVVGGGVEATALRVTLANDSTGVVSVDDGGGAITVDGTVTADAGSGPWPVTDNSGSLTVDNAGTFAVQESNAHTADFDTGAGTDTTTAFGIAVPANGGAAIVPGDATAGLKVNLGADNDVTVTGTVTVDASGTAVPVTDNAGSLTVDNAALSVTGGGAEATALRVTLANDSTGVVSVDDNAGSLTVDNAGTFAVQVDGSALTALQLIDNSIVAHDAAISGATGVNVIGLNARSSDPTAVTAADATQALATLLGKSVNYPYAIPGSTWSYAAASGGITNTTGVTVKAAGAAGVRNYITRCQVINGHATVSTDVQIRDGASGTVLWRGFAQAAGGGVTAVFDPPLRGTAATLVEVACGTTGSATYFNLQGFTAAE